MNTQHKEKYAIVLAAGKGTRMKSDIPKVLHELNGTPLVHHVLNQTLEAGIQNIILVVGFEKDRVIQSVEVWAKNKSGISIAFVEQAEQRGTGHAVMMAENNLRGKDATVIILLGDVPLIQSKTIKAVIDKLESQGNHCIVVTTELEDSSGYGRIVRNAEDFIEKIVEEKDASDAEKQIKEINSGIFAFENHSLWSSLKKIEPNNSQGEYYLTDIIEILKLSKKNVTAQKFSEPIQFKGINSIDQLNSLAASAN